MRTRIITTLFLTCLFASVSMAQITTVTSMKETTDFIPGDDQRRDFNNKVCALVKVQVLDEIVDVEGNVMGDMISRGVEKWVYMAQGSRNMKIHLKNNLPVTVKFKDYDISSLNSGRVYILVIDAPNQPQNDSAFKVNGNNLQMKISPTNANVTVWGDNYQKKIYRPQDDGTISVYLPYGRYHYQITAKNYQEKSGSVFVNDENKWENISLEVAMGTLNISCPTDNIDIYINGVKMDVNKESHQQTYSLEPGSYSVTVAKDNHISQSKEIDVIGNETSNLQYDRLYSNKEQTEIELQKKRAAEKGQIADVKETPKNNPTNNVTKVQGRSEEKEKIVSFGIRAGANLASLGLDSKVGGTCSMATSFYAGLSTDIKLANPIHLYTSLLFSQKGYKYENPENSLEENATAQFVMLPIQLSFRLSVFQINVGPYIEYGIGGKIDFNNSGETDTFEYYDPLNYGVTAGIGVLLGNHFLIGANYELGISNYANRNIAIGIGYYF